MVFTWTGYCCEQNSVLQNCERQVPPTAAVSKKYKKTLDFRRGVRSKGGRNVFTGVNGDCITRTPARGGAQARCSNIVRAGNGKPLGPCDDLCFNNESKISYPTSKRGCLWGGIVRVRTINRQIIWCRGSPATLRVALDTRLVVACGLRGLILMLQHVLIYIDYCFAPTRDCNRGGSDRGTT